MWNPIKLLALAAALAAALASAAPVDSAMESKVKEYKIGFKPCYNWQCSIIGAEDVVQKNNDKKKTKWIKPGQCRGYQRAQFHGFLYKIQGTHAGPACRLRVFDEPDCRGKMLMQVDVDTNVEPDGWAPAQGIDEFLGGKSVRLAC